MRDWSRYIGIPFVDLGRDFAGCDCYGLVRLALEQEFGKALPMLLGEYENTCDHEVVGGVVDRWKPLLSGRKVVTPSEGDVAVINVAGADAHIGLYIGSNMILHAWRKATGSVLQRTDHPFFRGRIEGYYRVL